MHSWGLSDVASALPGPRRKQKLCGCEGAATGQCWHPGMVNLSRQENLLNARDADIICIGRNWAKLSVRCPATPAPLPHP